MKVVKKKEKELHIPVYCVHIDIEVKFYLLLRHLFVHEYHPFAFLNLSIKYWNTVVCFIQQTQNTFLTLNNIYKFKCLDILFMITTVYRHIHTHKMYYGDNDKL